MTVNSEERALHEKRLRYLERKERSRILGLAASEEHPQIYSIGIADRYGISIIEQQLKAFLLAKTLIESKKINRNTRIAVVGAGAAGLSFAVAVATKKKCEVTVFEKEDSVLPLLTRVHWRWVVPIYDFIQSYYFSEKTSLPFLNWEADYAWKVARDLKRKWEVYKSHFPIKEVLSASVQFTHLKPTKPPQLLINGKVKKFDLVIVATGFGQVDELTKKDNYWLSGHPNNYRPRKSNEKVLISGNGDAGLVELFHFCIKDFYHDDILSFYDWKASGTTLHRLMDSVRHTRDNISFYQKSLLDTQEEKLYWFDVQQSFEKPALRERATRMSTMQKLDYMDKFFKKRIAQERRSFDKMFKTLGFSKIYLDFLSKHLSKKFQITLNGLDELLFDGEKEVNVHNMILASALYKLRAFKYIHGKLEDFDKSKMMNPVSVKVGTERFNFDRIIIRHGKVISNIPGLTFRSIVEEGHEDQNESLNWARVIDRDDREFYHTDEIKKFVVMNYLNEVDTVTAAQVMEDKWGARK